MLHRADAIDALAGEPFDVLVIGGGITGAGVALDAATRGSRGARRAQDFAIGTSSRSSKLVHGGLRYLQNFDLGLVREALLERQMTSARAPPGQAVAADRPRLRRRPARPSDRPRVEHVRRHGGGQAVAARPPAPREDAVGTPARHRMIGGEEVAELLPALAAAARPAATCSTTARPTTSRFVLTVLAEAERFGAVAVNGVEAVGLLEEDGRACGARLRDARRSSRCGPPTSSTPPACGPTACARRSCTTRPRCR